MTNLQARKANPDTKINPNNADPSADGTLLGGPRSHRLLLLLPLGTGGLLALLLLLAWVLPQWQRLNADQQRLEGMEEKALRLLLLRAQLQSTIEAQERAEAQKRQLLGLIAGSGSLNTFMAQVNREAERHGVVLDVLQPAAPPPPAASKAGAKPAAAAAAVPAAAAAGGCGRLDATAGLTASQQSLAVRGRYPNLLAFMRALERLNLLVVQCNLALEQPAPKAASGDAKGPPPPVEPMLLRLELSLFEQGPSARPRGVRAAVAPTPPDPAPAEPAPADPVP
jgi:type IV pilus assembly protein PilO